MIDIAAYVKSLSGLFKDIYVVFAKRFVQPKIEVDVLNVYRESVDSERDAYGRYIYVPVYNYTIRLINNSEHNAYHLKLTSCDAEVYRGRIDYHTPVLSHDLLSVTLYIKDPNTIKGNFGETTIGELVPPIKKLTIQYSNSKGKKFFTEFFPDEPIETQNKFGKVK